MIVPNSFFPSRSDSSYLNPNGIRFALYSRTDATLDAFTKIEWEYFLDKLFPQFTFLFDARVYGSHVIRMSCYTFNFSVFDEAVNAAPSHKGRPIEDCKFPMYRRKIVKRIQRTF